MWILRPAFAAVAMVMMTGLPALAQPIEISSLGHAPVMSTSTTKLSSATVALRVSGETSEDA